MNKMVYLLDFDDVFNVLSRNDKYVRKSGWNKERWRKTEYAQYGAVFPVTYNEEAVEKVNSLNGDKLWLSTWMHNYAGKTGVVKDEELDKDLLRSKRFLESLGFEKFDVLDGAGASSWGGIEWKVRAVQWLFEHGDWKRVVWFDDQLTQANGKGVLKKDARNAGVEFVGVTVRAGLGLTKKEIEEVSNDY